MGLLITLLILVMAVYSVKSYLHLKKEYKLEEKLLEELEKFNDALK